ncbi:unnamed protein product [Sphagnum balticum]
MELQQDEEEKHDQQQEHQQQGLIPDLPDEVAYRCLSRVSIQSHAQLHGVSRKWRDFVSSREFYEQRKQEGVTKHCVCMLQALPRTHPSLQHPTYGVSMLDEESQVWEWLPPIPEFSHYGLPLFCRLASVNGMLLVVGGWHPRTWETLRTVYMFNFATRRWQRGADMPSTRSSFACQAFMGSYVVVAGGHDNARNALSTAEMYNTERDCWQVLPNMNDSRDECSSAVIDEEFYVVSGNIYNNQLRSAASHQCLEFVRSSEIFKPKLNKWTRADIVFTHAAAGVISRSSSSCNTRSSSASPCSRIAADAGAGTSTIMTRTNLHSNNNHVVVVAGTSTSTSTTAAATTTAQQLRRGRTLLPLFGFHKRDLVCYSTETDEWQLLDVLPEGDDSIIAPVCISALGSHKLFVTGPQNKDTNSFTSLIYNTRSAAVAAAASTPMMSCSTKNTRSSTTSPSSSRKKMKLKHHHPSPAPEDHEQQQLQDHHQQLKISPTATNLFRGKWEFLRPGKKFQGVILTSCVVEI